MTDDKPKDSITEQIRALEPGEVLTYVTPAPLNWTLREMGQNVSDFKQSCYTRFHKTVGRVRQQNGRGYRIGTQLVWDDRLGLRCITTITRRLSF